MKVLDKNEFEKVAGGYSGIGAAASGLNSQSGSSLAGGVIAGRGNQGNTGSSSGGGSNSRSGGNGGRNH